MSCVLCRGVLCVLCVVWYLCRKKCVKEWSCCCCWCWLSPLSLPPKPSPATSIPPTTPPSPALPPPPLPPPTLPPPASPCAIASKVSTVSSSTCYKTTHTHTTPMALVLSLCGGGGVWEGLVLTLISPPVASNSFSSNCTKSCTPVILIFSFSNYKQREFVWVRSTSLVEWCVEWGVVWGVEWGVVWGVVW